MIFSDDEPDAVKLAESIRAIIFEAFYLEIPVFVISQDELKCLLSKAPSWWGSDSKDIYDNLIFVIASHCIETVAEKIGEPTEKIEKDCFYFFHSHFHCVQLIKFFFFQRCRETFHAAVVVTFAYITHALNSMQPSEQLSIFSTRVLASRVAMHYLTTFSVKFLRLRREKKFGKGKERNYCGSVRVIFGNYADRTFYDGKKSF